MTLNRTSWVIGIVALMNQAAFAAIDPTVLPVRYGQFGGSVAVGPHNTLVTWIDYRRTEDMAHEIFGTRIGPLGETLDGDGIPLTGLADGGAAVAALGDQFLIAWSKGPNIYARRMTSAGELLDTQPIAVSANPAHPFPELVYLRLTAASDGAHFWVAWTDDRSMPAGTPEYLRYEYQDIYTARISRGGQVLDPRGIRVCARRGNQNTPQLSPNADFIVWSDYRGGKPSIFGARLHRKGFPLDFGGFKIASSTNEYMTAADVSGNGRGWLVVWADASSAIHGAQVRKDRALLPPFTIVQTNAYFGLGVEPMGLRAAPQVESTGKDYLVLWQSGWSTVGTRVSNSKRAGPVVVVARDPAGAAFYSFGGFAGNGSRCWAIGTTAPISDGWFANEIWLGSFTPSMFP